MVYVDNLTLIIHTLLTSQLVEYKRTVCLYVEIRLYSCLIGIVSSNVNRTMLINNLYYFITTYYSIMYKTMHVSADPLSQPVTLSHSRELRKSSTSSSMTLRVNAAAAAAEGSPDETGWSVATTVDSGLEATPWSECFASLS